MSAKYVNPWVIVAYCCLMQAFTVGIGIYSFALFVVPWMETFSVERSILMVAITGSSIASALLAPVAGILMDKYDSKRLILVGQLVFIFGLVGIGASPDHWFIVAIFIVILPVGIILAGSLMAYSIAARRVKERRGLAMGITALGTSLGGVMIPVVVTWFLASYDWREVYFLLSLLMLVVVFLPAIFLLTPDTPLPKGGQAAKQDQGDINFLAVGLLGVCFLVPAFLFISVLHNIGAFALDIGVSQQQAALVISLASLLMAAGKVVSGALSDSMNQFIQYLVILFALATAMVITALAQNFLALLLGVALLSLFYGGVAPLVASIISRCWPLTAFGRVMGFASAFAGLSGIGSLVAAGIRDATGSYTAGFLWLSLSLVPAFACFIWLQRINTKNDLDAIGNISALADE